MQKKLFFYCVCFFAPVLLHGMNTEQESLIQAPTAITMEHKNDCGNCWREGCSDACEKACMCLAAPCIGCICCYLVVSDPLLFGK